LVATPGRDLTRLGLVTHSPPSAPRPPTNGSRQRCRTNAGRRTPAHDPLAGPTTTRR
jgi:hypothetical protein